MKTWPSLPASAAAARAAGHDGGLPLVADPIGVRRQVDHRARADHRGRRLEEQQRLLGHGIAQLLRVLEVVTTDADDLAGPDGEHAVLRVGER